MAITLSADAKYGFGGKQFVARVLGRDPKFTFRREFIGRKAGKRGESTSVLVDEPGLYQTRDIDRKGGADDSFAIVWHNGRELQLTWLDTADAMIAAKQIESGDDPSVVGRAFWIAALEALIADAATKDQDEEVVLPRPIGALEAGNKYPRRVIQEARRAALAALTQPAETDDKAARVERVRALMAELGVTIEELR